MKKLASLLICLCCLCAFALAEGEINLDSVETLTYDLGDFTIDVSVDDYVQQSEKADNAVFFVVYPDFAGSTDFNPYYNIAWTQQDLSAVFNQMEAAELAQKQLDGPVASYNAMGVAVDNARVTRAEYSEDLSTLTMHTVMDVDYSGMGVDLQMTLHQAQVWMDLGEAGGYIFSFTAADEPGLEAMLACMDTLQFS